MAKPPKITVGKTYFSGDLERVCPRLTEVKKATWPWVVGLYFDPDTHTYFEKSEGGRWGGIFEYTRLNIKEPSEWDESSREKAQEEARKNTAGRIIENKGTVTERYGITRPEKLRAGDIEFDVEYVFTDDSGEKHYLLFDPGYREFDFDMTSSAWMSPEGLPIGGRVSFTSIKYNGVFILWSLFPTYFDKLTRKPPKFTVGKEYLSLGTKVLYPDMPFIENARWPSTTNQVLAYEPEAKRYFELHTGGRWGYEKGVAVCLDIKSPEEWNASSAIRAMEKRKDDYFSLPVLKGKITELHKVLHPGLVKAGTDELKLHFVVTDDSGKKHHMLLGTDYTDYDLTAPAPEDYDAPQGFSLGASLSFRAVPYNDVSVIIGLALVYPSWWELRLKELLELKFQLQRALRDAAIVLESSPDSAMAMAAAPIHAAAKRLDQKMSKEEFLKVAPELVAAATLGKPRNDHAPSHRLTPKQRLNPVWKFLENVNSAIRMDHGKDQSLGV